MSPNTPSTSKSTKDSKLSTWIHHTLSKEQSHLKQFGLFPLLDTNITVSDTPKHIYLDSDLSQIQALAASESQSVPSSILPAFYQIILLLTKNPKTPILKIYLCNSESDSDTWLLSSEDQSKTLKQDKVYPQKGLKHFTIER